jgi:hypothetical protein
MSNAENQKAYRGRELKKGRKKRTTAPLHAHEWNKVKQFIKNILNLRGSEK